MPKLSTPVEKEQAAMENKKNSQSHFFSVAGLKEMKQVCGDVGKGDER